MVCPNCRPIVGDFSALDLTSAHFTELPFILTSRTLCSFVVFHLGQYAAGDPLGTVRRAAHREWRRSAGHFHGIVLESDGSFCRIQRDCNCAHGHIMGAAVRDFWRFISPTQPTSLAAAALRVNPRVPLTIKNILLLPDAAWAICIVK